MELIQRLGLGFVMSFLIGYAGQRKRVLTRGGWLGAVLVGTSIFGFSGLAGGLLLIAFFISASLLTRYKEYAKREVAENFAKGGPRDLAQALANGGIAALAAMLSAFGAPQYAAALFAALAGALATANADTWATELGVLSTRSPRLIINARIVAPGTSGGVTWLGTLAALSGAGLIAALAALLMGDVRLLPIGLLAGLAGSLFDSLLGATVQGLYYSETRKKETEKPIERDGARNRHLRGWTWMTNDVVNLLATLAGAFVAYGLAAGWR